MKWDGGERYLNPQMPSTAIAEPDQSQEPQILVCLSWVAGP